MAWTQADIDALKAVIGSGVLTVRYSDRQVTYQNTADMQKALADMQAEVGGASGTRPAYRLVATRKGL